ncbi:hypothetical protein OSB04_030002 [Centaurea solstitialis]|uniref:Yippee domain-containing protein n=1 Tax=Centaurea solstitialis TaxID=347529 RepID=A0AA38S607_9ASTR|nr:hypothetical protein OSB04_030002 [Centaurea solstitialis]
MVPAVTPKRRAGMQTVRSEAGGMSGTGVGEWYGNGKVVVKLMLALMWQPMQVKNYTILEEDDIRQRQEDEITKISAVLSISRDSACMLLRRFNWSVSNVYEAWFANEDKVRKAVGLLDKTDIKQPKSGEVACGICFESYPVDKISTAAFKSCDPPQRHVIYNHHMFYSVNVTLGAKEDRLMMTRLHTVTDIFCVKCGSIVGWTYETAHDKNQKYKEGKSVLERLVPNSIKYPNMSYTQISISKSPWSALHHFKTILMIFENSFMARGRLRNAYPGKCLPSRITLWDEYDKDHESYPVRAKARTKNLTGK